MCNYYIIRLWDVATGKLKVMDNETFAIIVIFGTPLALMLVGTVWWAWKDKDNS